jgi:hypothetical protein
MQKVMIPPLVVGFICLFVSIVMALSPVTASFNTDSKGNVTVGTTEWIDATNALTIAHNGFTDGGYFGGIRNTDNQTGVSGYNVYYIHDSWNQYWDYNIPNSSKQVTVIYYQAFGSNAYLHVEVSSSIDITLSSLIPKIVNGNIVNQSLDLGIPGSGNAGTNWQWQITITPISGYTLTSALTQGYGFTVYIDGVNRAADGASGNIMGANGFVVIFIAAAIIGGVAAITVFGSKIDFFGQKLIFASATYIVLWAILSAGMINLVLGIPILGIMIWLALSAMYVIGMIEEVLGGNAGATG